MDRIVFLILSLLLVGCQPPPVWPFYDEEKYLREANEAWVNFYDAHTCPEPGASGQLPPVDGLEPTRTIWLDGNLDPEYPLAAGPDEAANGTVTLASVVDELGNPHNVWIRFMRVAKNEWMWRFEPEGDTPVWEVESNPPARLVFDEQGLLKDVSPSTAPGYYSTGAYSLGWWEPCKSFENNTVTLGVKELDPNGLTQKPQKVMLVTAWVDEAKTIESAFYPSPNSETLTGELEIPGASAP